jgi:hypothetical protein
MSAIERCRTAALGGHVERCEACAHLRISYNSCRNRHCPKCQAAAAKEWLAERQAELLPVPYFHVVFTLPGPIADIAYHNKALVYDLLLKAAAETLITIAADPKHLGARDPSTRLLRASRLRTEVIQQRLRLCQIARVEAFREPAVYRGEEVARRCPSSSSFAPQPSKVRRGAQLIPLGLLLPRDAQRLLESNFALFEAVEADQRNTLQTIKFRAPPKGLRFLLHLHPLPDRSDSRAMLPLARQGLGEPGESVGAKRSRTEPAGKRVAQARDRLLEPTLRA